MQPLDKLDMKKLMHTTLRYLDKLYRVTKHGGSSHETTHYATSITLSSMALAHNTIILVVT